MIRAALNYLALLWPAAHRRMMQRERQRAYHEGWGNGFDRGHLRGFVAMRNRTKNGNRYQYVPPKPDERN
jgi:hypothetical protein